MSIEAVTFDHWNTLVSEDNDHLRTLRVRAWAGVLEGAGFAAEHELLDAAFDRGWERFVASWTANQQYLAAQAAADILEDLGYDVPPDVRDALVEAFGRPSVWQERDVKPTPGIEDCLRTLKGAGIKLGIVCDVGITPSTELVANLERRGVLELFDHWSFSDDVGFYKPAPEIFEHALRGLGGVPASRTAHVGDLRRTDVAGALAMGMTAIRYTGIFDDKSTDEPEATHVISHHRELPKVLGLG